MSWTLVTVRALSTRSSAAVLFLALGLLTSSGRAQLFSPGPLSRGHSELSGLKNCIKCHSGNRDKACLNCHSEIQTRIEANKGFHAKQQNRLKKSCVSCHSEHKGVKYDLTGLDRNPFDHDESGWPLIGNHETVKCQKCHTQKRSDVAQTKSRNTTYLLAKSACVSCHQKDDVHKGGMGLECEGCHLPFGWKQILPSKGSHKPSSVPSLTTPVVTPPTSAPSATIPKVKAPEATKRPTLSPKDVQPTLSPQAKETLTSGSQAKPSISTKPIPKPTAMPTRVPPAPPLP